MNYNILPIGTFSLTVLSCYSYSKISKSFGKYTIWSYIENILLIPYLFFESTRSITADIIWCNSIGLLGGIHSFYMVTGYKLLIEFGDATVKYNKHIIIYLIGDLILHGLPTLFSIIFLKNIKRYSNHIWLLTAIPHTFFCYSLIGTFHPHTLYRVKKRNTLQVMLGWSGIFFSHKIAMKLRNK